MFKEKVHNPWYLREDKMFYAGVDVMIIAERRDDKAHSVKDTRLYEFVYFFVQDAAHDHHSQLPGSFDTSL